MIRCTHAAKVTFLLSGLMANIGGPPQSRRSFVMAITDSILLYSSENCVDALRVDCRLRILSSIQRTKNSNWQRRKRSWYSLRRSAQHWKLTSRHASPLWRRGKWSATLVFDCTLDWLFGLRYDMLQPRQLTLPSYLVGLWLTLGVLHRADAAWWWPQ